MSIAGKAAIVGVGTTEYYKRGTSPKSRQRLACEAIVAACDDAGLSVKDIDGFSGYSEQVPPSVIAPSLGIPEMRYSAYVWGGGGGGSCAAIGNAVAAIAAGYANVVVLYHALRRTDEARYGGSAALVRELNPWCDPYGLLTPAQQFALMVRRHMHEFGTTYEHLGHLAITQREHARRNPHSMMTSPLTMDEYLAGRMIADPFRLFDCTLENDGAAALIITSTERARDLRQPAAHVLAVSQGGPGIWGAQLYDQNAPSPIYPSAGHASIARTLYERAGVGPLDIDVAQLYDHFSGMVLMELEDYGFCPRGESGPFVAEGRALWPHGELPINTHGGNLSEVNIHGTTHLIEGVRQIRGTSACQVEGAELCLVTGGPSPIPSSSMILAKA